LLTLWTLMAAAAQSATILVGDPRHPDSLPKAIVTAQKQGWKEIVIAPGVYDLPSQNHGDTIILDGVPATPNC